MNQKEGLFGACRFTFLEVDDADILILADESLSQAPGNSGDDLVPWINDIVPQLEQKLTGRQIGGTDAVEGNRYAVMAFGNDSNGNNSLKMFNGSPWVDAEDVDELTSQFANTGQHEDPYKALASDYVLVL